MSKPIKLEEYVYLELNEAKQKGETFSDVVNRLLVIRRMAHALNQSLPEQINSASALRNEPAQQWTGEEI